jgi:cysteine desulfurase / selenocysteine lyase
MADMATGTSERLDAARVRADFPIFERPSHGRPLAFLDSAASAQKPRAVLDAMDRFYETSYANVHRSVYELAELATEALESSRSTVARFVNAWSPREIVFVRNATEALNLVAYAWGADNLGPGDIVLATQLEHHSNFVPWQAAAERTGATFRILPVDDEGELRLDLLDATVAGGVLKVVAIGGVSNALGTINPVEQIAAWAHARDAIVVVDAAQSAPHQRVDVQALGADFVAISAHKLCGPSGIGSLWGRAALLQEMRPFLYGGHMIASVEDDHSTWAELPHKFEAGTAPMAEAVGFAAAIDYLEAVGLEAIARHERELTVKALGLLGERSWVRLYGPPAERRSGIVSFGVEGVHPHDVAQVLDFEGVAIRAGHHCCQPLMRRLGVLATNRASFYLYTLSEDVDRLVDAVDVAKERLG